MKSTGIIRRIDDLGRIVIPKEVRRTLRIKEGDSFELLVDKDMVCFKKYSFLGEIEEEACKIVQSYKENNLIITDMDHILSSRVFGRREKKLPEEYIDAILKRCPNEIEITIPNTDIFNAYIVPIISEGEVVGSVAAVNYTKEPNLSILEFAASLLKKSMECD